MWYIRDKAPVAQLDRAPASGAGGPRSSRGGGTGGAARPNRLSRALLQGHREDLVISPLGHNVAAGALRGDPKTERCDTWSPRTAALRWTKGSYFLMSGLLATMALVVLVWWPLVQDVLSYFDPHRPWWTQLDWLLLGIFGVMTLLITAGADVRADSLTIIVAAVGGLVIESWGTRTQLWTYYTLERPPLWIIPAWPIATLSINRLVRLLWEGTARLPARPFRRLYWLFALPFLGLMLFFVWPTMGQPFTMMAFLTCFLLLLSPGDHRLAVLILVAGSGLGYFLERWGTTRACWTYYTGQTPPLFAVLAHGIAALAFWRTERLVRWVLDRVVRERWVARRSRGKSSVG